MSFMEGDLHVRVAQLLTENKRLEQRVDTLEKLVCVLYGSYYDEWPDRAESVYLPRMRELGIEVEQ